jgi:hypothetical protein
MDNFSQDSWWSSEDSDWTPTKYKPEVSLFEPTCSVTAAQLWLLWSFDSMPSISLHSMVTTAGSAVTVFTHVNESMHMQKHIKP